MKKKTKAFLTILGLGFLGDIILLLIYGIPVFKNLSNFLILAILSTVITLVLERRGLLAKD